APSPTYTAPHYTPPSYTPPSYTVPTYTIPTTTTLPCPTGRPTVEVTSVRATPEEYLDGYWKVHVEGRVVNNAEGTIDLGSVAVHIEGTPPTDTVGLTNSYSLRPGEASTWSADEYAMKSSSAPSAATAKLDYWSWG